MTDCCRPLFVANHAGGTVVLVTRIDAEAGAILCVRAPAGGALLSAPAQTRGGIATGGAAGAGARRAHRRRRRAIGVLLHERSRVSCAAPPRLHR